jgi:hypothetical protein
MHRSTFRANPLVLVLTMTAAAAVCSANAAPASDNTCSVRATGPAPTVVELYTSEGCSSCPPAEAWLNGLSGRQDMLALSFHVTYWDYLGWPDRFASRRAQTGNANWLARTAPAACTRPRFG